MAEDKIRKIAEKLSEQMPPHFRKAETARAERILREELEGLMKAAKDVLRGGRHSGECDDDYDQDYCSLHLAAAKKREEKLKQLLAEYGWPWRKRGE